MAEKKPPPSPPIHAPSKNPIQFPAKKTIQVRSYTSSEFRGILVTLYGAMRDWDLAEAAMEDFNSNQSRIYRWLAKDKAITGPAVALADKLIEEHNAKTGRKP